MMPPCVKMWLVRHARLILRFWYLWTRRRGALVLYYHCITSDPQNGCRSKVYPEVFLEQLEALSSWGFEIISTPRLLQSLSARTVLSPYSVAIQFDDGYLDNWELLVRAASHGNVPMAVFVPTGFIGQQRWFSYDTAKWSVSPVEGDGYYECKFLGPDEIRALHSNGIHVYPHSVTHPTYPGTRKSLTSLSLSRMREEVRDSRAHIEAVTGGEADCFCYPLGDFDDALVQILKDEGFSGAFTIREGRLLPSCSPYELPRCHPGNSVWLLLTTLLRH